MVLSKFTCSTRLRVGASEKGRFLMMPCVLETVWAKRRPFVIAFMRLQGCSTNCIPLPPPQPFVLTSKG